MSAGAWWTLALVGILAALWWWAEVYMPRVHMREAMRDVDALYPPSPYPGHVPPRPLPAPAVQRWYGLNVNPPPTYDRPPPPPNPPGVPGAFRDVMRDGQLIREVSFTNPEGVVQTMRLCPAPPRKCRFKRGRKA